MGNHLDFLLLKMKGVVTIKKVYKSTENKVLNLEEERVFDDKLLQGKEVEDRLIAKLRKHFKVVKPVDEFNQSKFARKFKVDRDKDIHFYKSTPDVLISDGNDDGLFIEVKSFNSEIFIDTYRGNAECLSLRQDQLSDYYDIQESSGITTCLLIIVTQPVPRIFGITLDDFISKHYNEYSSGRNNHIYFKTLVEHFITLQTESEMIEWINQILQNS